MRRRLLRALLMVGSGATGGGALTLLGAPSPALFAGFLAAAVVSLVTDADDTVPVPIGRAAQAILGATVATQIDLDGWSELRHNLPAVVVAATLTIAVAILMGQLLRRRGASQITAVLASVPGGASTVTSIADDLGADRRTVVVLQYLRVVVVIITLPMLLAVVFDASLSHVGAARAVRASDLAYVPSAAVLGLVGGRLIRLPAAGVVGPLLAGLALGLTPAFAGSATPPSLQWVAFLAIGLQSGSGFTRSTLIQLRGLMPVALVTSVGLVGFCALAAVPFALWTGSTALDAYLATSPGGLPVVVATSLDTGTNPALVSVTQVVRLIAVIVVLPIILAVLRRRP